LAVIEISIAVEVDFKKEPANPALKLVKNELVTVKLKSLSVQRRPPSFATVKSVIVTVSIVIIKLVCEAQINPPF
jgi:hypothetical protein